MSATAHSTMSSKRRTMSFSCLSKVALFMRTLAEGTLMRFRNSFDPSGGTSARMAVTPRNTSANVNELGTVVPSTSGTEKCFITISHPKTQA